MNVLFALLGMGLAYKLFAKEAQDVKGDTLFKKVVLNKFYIDEIYGFFVLKPLLILSHFIAEVMDPKIFDGFINFNVWGYRKSALYFSKLQNGKVRYYALYILIGVSGMSCYLLLKLGAL
jgi:NADH-quinone oxidoreductase subunit L